MANETRAQTSPLADEVRLIVNPAAGRGIRPDAVRRLQALYEAAGLRVTLLRTNGAGDAGAFARDCGADTRHLAIAGGDGTLSQALGGLLHAAHRPPVCYIPMGSANDFARSAGLPLDPMKAAACALSGRTFAVDAGRMNGRAFTYVACFGAFSRTSYLTGQRLKNRLGHLAYVLTGAKELAAIHPYAVRVETGEGTLSGEYLFGAVCNTRSLGGMLRLRVPREALCDGRHELLLVKPPRDIFQALSLLWTVANGRTEHPLITCRHIDRAVFHMPEGCPWSLDGEYMPGAAIHHFENLYGAWTLSIPGEQTS